MGELIDESGLARLVALKPSYLRKLRISGGGPKFIKIGRSVRYRLTDVESWLASRTRRNTAEGG